MHTWVVAGQRSTFPSRVRGRDNAPLEMVFLPPAGFFLEEQKTHLIFCIDSFLINQDTSFINSPFFNEDNKVQLKQT